MGTTFLALTNKVLKKINEVQLDQSTFSDVLGIHAAAKDSINDAIQKINTQKFEWPFNMAEGTQVLVPGQVEYPYPADFKTADWNSFYIEADGTHNSSTQHLRFMNVDEWYDDYRSRDLDAGSNGIGLPYRVFRGAGQNFGITPSPDRPYVVKYKYFKKCPEMVLATDECRIPSQFDYVILSAAMWYMYLWRENEQRAQLAEGEYEKNLNHMTNLLLGSFDRVRDTVIATGGGRTSFFF